MNRYVKYARIQIVSSIVLLSGDNRSFSPNYDLGFESSAIL